MVFYVGKFVLIVQNGHQKTSLINIKITPSSQRKIGFVGRPTYGYSRIFELNDSPIRGPVHWGNEPQDDDLRQSASARAQEESEPPPGPSQRRV